MNALHTPVSMSHAEVVQAEGDYLLALPAIRATDEFDDSLIEALPWIEIEHLSGYCLDRTDRWPSGSFYAGDGSGSQQRTCNEGMLCAAPRVGAAS